MVRGSHNVGMEPKTCSSCGADHPSTTEHFYGDPKCADGLKPYCKDCSKKKSRRHYADNRERHLKRQREYDQAHAEEIRGRREANAEQHGAYNRDYYRRNRERILPRQRNYERERQGRTKQV